MTQARSVGVGAEYLADATQLPTARTFVAVAADTNRLTDLSKRVKFRDVSLASGNTTYTFEAPCNGRVAACLFTAGASAADGTNGVKIVVTNTTNSADVLASFGFGSATNAAAGVDNTTAVSANVSVDKACSDTSFFNKGDTILITDTKDGTFTYSGEIVLEFGSQGR